MSHPETARVRAYLALQEKIRREVWPVHYNAIHDATTPEGAFAIDAATKVRIAESVTGGRSLRFAHPFNAWLEAAMLEHFEHRCAYCRRPLLFVPWKYGVGASDSPYALAYHLDHVTPKSKGGANNFTNYVPACAECNSAKRAKSPEDWTP